ncbi:EamA-like transporter family protein [Thermosyntropha lipolytica DSM 11003]|uniref:EamA-like transporter family protein n=1 Tax=Thermosyntropha lipolytica DSM 11003 TaxID=1123382 RepID=A0A1M5K9W0_9FIRM|nr:DMT family transporter [Thermosyntropha lipolytica]SHG49279.1 EamA-like transporter family protein [Thermosyntropha lipolytica DSM 11003]
MHLFLNSKQLKAEASMLLVAFIWGTTFVIVKNALADIGPFWFLALRFILAFLVLALLAFKNMQKIDFPTVIYGSVIGLFLFIGYTFQTIGLKYTTASNAGFITGLSVVLVPVIYSLMYRKKPETKTFLASLTALAGLFLLSFPTSSCRLNYGDLLVFICAIGFALHIILVDRYSYKHDPVAITGVQILFVGILSLLIAVPAEPFPPSLTCNAVYAILITSILATALAFLLQNGMQKYSTPTRFAIILTMEPVFAALAGYLWAGEMFSSRGLIGAGLILLSMLIAVLTPRIN